METCHATTSRMIFSEGAMPFVLLRVDEEVERQFIDDPQNMQLLRGVIVGAIDPELDPDNDLDVNIVVRHPAAHSKYKVTVDIEMMRTKKRARKLDSMTRSLHQAMTILFGRGNVNVWIKLVHAGYAPSD